MLSNPVSDSLDKALIHLYNKHHDLATHHKYIAKGMSPLISFIDATSIPVYDCTILVESIALVAINLVGSLFSFLSLGRVFNKCSLSDSFKALRFSVFSVTEFIGDTILLPFNFCFQTIYLFKNPSGKSLNASLESWLNPPKPTTPKKVIAAPNPQKSSYLNRLITSIKNVSAKILSNPTMILTGAGLITFQAALFSNHPIGQTTFLLTGTLMLVTAQCFSIFHSLVVTTKILTDSLKIERDIRFISDTTLHIENILHKK